MRFAHLLLALAAAPSAAGPVPHPSSASRSRIAVDGARVLVELRVQTASVLEVVAADENGNAFLEPAELDGARAEIERYALEHFRLRVDSLGDAERGRELRGRLTALSSPMRAPDPVFVEQWVDLGLDFESAGAVQDLRIEMTLFLDTSPAHFDDCTLVWNAGEPERAILSAARTTWHVRSSGAGSGGTLRLYLRLGVEHILGGYDHIAFVLALLVAARGLRSLVGVVTAFTVAHSVTLALAAFGVVSLAPRLVEIAIALSVAYVAAENLLRDAPARTGALWIEAFAFGLLHGLGFAGFLGEFLEAEPRRALALVGFNLGVELGQLAVVALAVAFVRAVPRAAGPAAPTTPGGETALVSPTFRRTTSALVCAVGLYWFVRRAWF